MAAIFEEWGHASQRAGVYHAYALVNMHARIDLSYKRKRRHEPDASSAKSKHKRRHEHVPGVNQCADDMDALQARLGEQEYKAVSEHVEA